MRIQEISSPRLGYRHRGLEVTDWTGASWVYANVPGQGVVRQSREAFASGRPYSLEPINSGLSPAAIVARAESAIGRKPYDTIEWNCDHFVNWALGKPVQSEQLRFYAAVAVVGLAVAAFAPKGAIRAIAQ